MDQVGSRTIFSLGAWRQHEERQQNGEKKMSPFGTRQSVSRSGQRQLAQAPSRMTGRARSEKGPPYLPQEERRKPNQGKAGKSAICFPFSYTGKCTREGCSYLHVCFDCGEGHSQVSCPQETAIAPCTHTPPSPLGCDLVLFGPPSIYIVQHHLS